MSTPYTDYGEYLIPTIEELHEATQELTNASIKQILNGQAIYFGYECKGFFDNEIPIVSSIEKIEKSRADFKNIKYIQNQLLRLGIATSREEIRAKIREAMK